MTLKSNRTDHSYSWGSKLIDRHPVIANIVIILIIAVLGIYVAYLASAIFTKHGRSLKVPRVENLTYTEAIVKLHNAGLKVDIRDSLYREDLRPGCVIEQFPKANSIVKPGRKVFLYINSVHPKEVILDDDNHPNELALKGTSPRSAMAKLEELGFKNIKVVKVLGTSDRVVKVLANGRPVRKTQKIPVNSSIVIEVSDGRLYDLEDSLSSLEYINMQREEQQSSENYDVGVGGYEEPVTSYETHPEEESGSEEENSQYF